MRDEEAAPSPYVDSLWEEYAEVAIADVIVDVDAPDLQASYSYRVPEALQNTLRPGDCVHIGFGGRETLGWIMARRNLPANDALCAKLKPILGRIEDAITINAEQLALIQWMSARYVCDLLAALRCVAPATLGARVETRVRLTDPQLRGRDVGTSIGQAHLVETLHALNGDTELETLRESANLASFSGAYNALLRKSLVVETRSIARARTVGKTMKAYRLGASSEVIGQAGMGRRSAMQQRLLNELIERARFDETAIPADELLRAAQASPASLKGLLDKGLVQASEITIRRAPHAVQGPRTVAPPLTPGQQAAADTLRDAIARQEAQTVLLFGVTASGKTEVYLDAIAHTLAAGRSAIVLVPEIALTTQVVEAFVGRFGSQVAVLHSKLSEGERHDEWRRMQAGEARIVVGARSAIFAPVENVGLIVMDEEHEASYKQDNTPRYNAKDLARERARLSRAVLLLGSATPSLESYHAALPNPPAPFPSSLASLRREGGAKPETFHEDSKLELTNSDPGSTSTPDDLDKAGFLGSTSGFPVNGSTPALAPPSRMMRSEWLGKGAGGLGHPPLLISMPERIDSRPLPRVDVVDMREEFKQRRALFAQRLIDAMQQRLTRKQQTILFLNRRGYAQFVLCRDCGWAAKCPNCAISLTFHAYDRSLKCHHCDFTGKAPLVCPDCGGARVKAFGLGTEKVEEEVHALFPHARVARMDRDTTATKGAHGRILREFRSGEADILIGTQMIAKGLDFPNVTLVGVVSADTAINMPDFRAGERTFQLLTQVAGRAGRGVLPGEVIIQTFSPDHYAVQAAVSHDYAAFYAQEIVFRKELAYPPFRRFVNLICADPEEPKASQRATKLAALLERIVPPDVEIIGPSPAPLARLKNQFRFHVALRATPDVPLSALVRDALSRLPISDRLGTLVDIDPLSMA